MDMYNRLLEYFGDFPQTYNGLVLEFFAVLFVFYVFSCLLSLIASLFHGRG